MRSLRFRLLSLPLLALLFWLAWLSWASERYVARLQAGEIPLEAARAWPLHFEPSLVAARMMLERGGIPLERIRAHLEAALDRRPRYAPAWLDLAELEFRAGRSDRARAHADHSRTLWPTRRRHLWRLFQFYLRLGEVERALSVLSVDLLADPGKAQPALLTLLALGVERERIAAALANPPVPHDGRYEAMALAVLRSGMRLEDLAFVEAWTASVPLALRRREPWLALRLELGFRLGDPRLICAAFTATRAGQPCLDAVRDPFLEEPFGDHRLRWRSRPGAGFEFQRPREGQGLTVVFDGSENLRFRNLRQFVPLSGPGTYRLRVRTRGADITTRSGPYLDVTLQCGEERPRARTRARTGSWTESEDAVTFAVPAGCPLAEVALARDASTDLDRFIGGRITVLEVELSRVSPGAEPDDGRG